MFWLEVFLHSISFWQDVFIYAIFYRPRWAREIYGNIYNILVHHYPEYRVHNR